MVPYSVFHRDWNRQSSGTTPSAAPDLEADSLVVHPAIVYSIPGSGTRFTELILRECFGYAKTRAPGSIPQASGAVFSQLHTDYEDSGAVLRTFPRDQRIIVPLRSPASTYLTLRARKGRDRYSLEGVKRLWAELKENLKRFHSPFFLPVEHNLDREGSLRRLATYLGVQPREAELQKMAREWRKVGSRGVVEAPIHPWELLDEDAWYTLHIVRRQSWGQTV